LVENCGMKNFTYTDGALQALVDDLAAIADVDSILLGGSRARGEADKASDYDIYIYSEADIPADIRKPIIDRHMAPGYELDNRYWETEDDGVLAANDIPIDIIYRSLSWLTGHLDDLLDRYSAGTGYTSCMWRNFSESLILFDREGKAEALQTRAGVPYPDRLADAIIKKNRPLLTGTMPCYRDQVAKAASRGDMVSVNHRSSAWLESYFDILFALNRVAHPGEKRIIDFLEKEAPVLPEGWKEDILLLVRMIGGDGTNIPAHMDKMAARLDLVLNRVGPF